MTVRKLHCLNRGFHSDLEWWTMSLSDWNGDSLLLDCCQLLFVSHWDMIITSDASGSWGDGAISSTGEWFQCPWPEEWKDVHITVKKLVPIVITALWGCYPKTL